MDGRYHRDLIVLFTIASHLSRETYRGWLLRHDSDFQHGPVWAGSPHSQAAVSSRYRNGLLKIGMTPVSDTLPERRSLVMCMHRFIGPQRLVHVRLKPLEDINPHLVSESERLSNAAKAPEFILRGFWNSPRSLALGNPEFCGFHLSRC